MVDILNVENFVKGLTPVTSTEISTRDGGFHVNGLFSESIFGTIGSIERRKTYSYIDLGAYVIHPTILRFLYRLDAKLKKFLSTEMNYTIENGQLFEDPSGISGILDFIKIFPSIEFKLGTEAREKIYEAVQTSYKNKTMFINKIPVIPPDYRDAYQNEEGEWVIDSLNDYYNTIMRRSINVKTSYGSGILFDLMNFSLQQAVVDHDKYIQTKIAKKSGIIRSQMLGKRIDFSARSVISPGPDLKINEVGLPLKTAATIFEPFLIHHLLYSGKVDQNILSEEIEKFVGIPLSVDSIRKVIKSIRVGDKLPPLLYDLFHQSTDSAIQGRAVIVKRDPSLHAESVRAFYPKLTDGNTVQLCTLTVTGFNADFDGDCAFCKIIIYNNDKTEEYHIKDLEYSNLFKLDSKKEKDNIIITKYKPLKELYIKSIDPKTGDINNKKIIQYSKHENIEMFKVHDNKNRFEDFWTSYDHSLIIYDKMTNTIRKISPKDLLDNPNGKFLIKKR